MKRPLHRALKNYHPDVDETAPTVDQARRIDNRLSSMPIISSDAIRAVITSIRQACSGSRIRAGSEDGCAAGKLALHANGPQKRGAKKEQSPPLA